MPASPFQFGAPLNLWGYLKAVVTLITSPKTNLFGITITIRMPAVNLTGDTDLIVTQKIRVMDAYCIATAAGGVGDTAQVKNGANAITDAMDCNKADQTITRAGTINDAFWDIAAGGTLRVTGASAVNVDVFIRALLVP